MRVHLANAAYGILDYAAYPIGMLLVAPIVLHRLGAAEYGIWTLATAAVSAGGIIASGFGDANIQHVASQRGAGNNTGLNDAVRSMVGINLVLGTVFALAGWLLTPYAARHIAASDSTQQHACLIALRIASFLMLVRALESVAISTQRAFERYGAAVRISILARLLTLASAGGFAYAGRGTVSIMQATAAIFLVGTWLQFHRLRHLLKGASLWPAFNKKATRALFVFGIFSWLQAVAGVLFSQVDRLLLGVSLGAVAVASYALCIQLAQPIFGLTASALHFLFPYLSGRVATISTTSLKQTLLQAFLCNLLLVAVGTALLLAFGVPMLRVWAGADIAQAAAPIFPVIVLGSALLGLSVTGTYALLALGQVRTIAWLSIGSGIAMLLWMHSTLPISGVRGLAIARLCYGSVSLFLYIPLLHSLHKATHTQPLRAALSELDQAAQL